MNNINILLDAFPECVNIDGKPYKINTDFRAGITFELMMQEGVTNPYKLLSPFFPIDVLKTFTDVTQLTHAVQAIQLFYCCGKLPEKKDKPTKTKQAYSFETDGSAIYADFWKHYGINLANINLHWWAFRSLLEGLPEKSEFKQRSYYRTCELKGLSKKERERITKYRKLIEIKDKTSAKMTLEERNAQMVAYIAKRREETAGGEK